MEKKPHNTVALFKLNNWLFDKAVKDLSEENAVKKITENSNPILWIAGHITYSRYAIMRYMQADVDRFVWKELYARGGRFSPGDDNPSLADVVKVWNTIGEVMPQKIDELTPEILASEIPAKFPAGDNSLDGVLNFLITHESYHLGQMSYIRTCLGLDGLVK